MLSQRILFQGATIFILSMILLAASESSSDSVFPSRPLREIATKRRQLNYIKSLLQDLDERLEKLQKRSCVLNLPGMDCDYGDITGSRKDQDFWGSRMAPGKKRRMERSIRMFV